MPLTEPFRFRARIRFIDTDASGRIHYTAMFRYFESAEIEFIRLLDLGYLEQEFAFPRVHVECDFRLALQYDDVIEVEVRLMQVGSSSVQYGFRTYQGERIAATGLVVVVCMNRQTQRATPLPDAIRSKLETVLADGLATSEDQ